MRAAETFGMRGKKMQTELRVCAPAARLFAAGLGKHTLIPLQNGEVGVQGEEHCCICAYHSNYTASSLNKQAVHIINIPQTPFYSGCRVINKLQVGKRSCRGKQGICGSAAVTGHGLKVNAAVKIWPTKKKQSTTLKTKGSMRNRRKPRWLCDSHHIILTLRLVFKKREIGHMTFLTSKTAINVSGIPNIKEATQSEIRFVVSEVMPGRSGLTSPWRPALE